MEQGLELNLEAMYYVDRAAFDELISVCAQQIDYARVFVDLQLLTVDLTRRSCEEVAAALEAAGVPVFRCVNAQEKIDVDCACAEQAFPLFGLSGKELLAYYVNVPGAFVAIPMSLPIVGNSFTDLQDNQAIAVAMHRGLNGICALRDLQPTSVRDIETWYWRRAISVEEPSGWTNLEFEFLEKLSPPLASKTLALLADSLDGRRLLIERGALATMSGFDSRCAELDGISWKTVRIEHIRPYSQEPGFWTTFEAAWLEELAALYPRFPVTLLEWARSPQGPHIVVDDDVPIRQRDRYDHPDELFLLQVFEDGHVGISSPTPVVEPRL